MVTAFLADRETDESFAAWVARADEDLLRGETRPGTSCPTVSWRWPDERARRAVPLPLLR